MLPADSQRLEANGLDPQGIYKVTLSPGDAQWRKGGRLDEVMVFIAGKPTAVLRKGAVLTITGTERATFTFPDSDLKENSGSLAITLER